MLLSIVTIFLLVGCIDARHQQMAEPSIAQSRILLEQVKTGEKTFSVAFKHFVSMRDIGGLYRLLWSIEVSQDDTRDVHSLLMTESDNNTYRLLRKIIRMDNGNGLASQVAASFVGYGLNVATSDLINVVVEQTSLTGVHLDQQRVIAEAESWNENYQHFSSIYRNVTQGSERAGQVIRKRLDTDVIVHLSDRNLSADSIKSLPEVLSFLNGLISNKIADNGPTPPVLVAMKDMSFGVWHSAIWQQQDQQ